MLKNLADRQGVSAIDRMEDLAPLLFRASVYSSYPLAWLERNEFVRLTRWLSKLTAIDLSSVDLDGVELIEDWIKAIVVSTGASVCYSTTTDGKMTFLLRSREEWRLFWEGGRWRQLAFQTTPLEMSIE